MRRYETIVLLNPELASEQVAQVVERYQQLITANAGELLKLDDWGQRPLAYPVEKHTRGYYTLIDYCGQPGTVQELERNLRIDERCMKFLTVKTADSADPAQIRELLRQETEARAAEAEARAAEAAAREAAQAAEAAAREAAQAAQAAAREAAQAAQAAAPEAAQAAAPEAAQAAAPEAEAPQEGEPAAPETGRES